MVTSISAAAKEEIQRKLDEAVQAKITPGLVFGVTSAKGELFWGQSGLKDIGNPDAGPITPESVFWICSQTKMITAIAAFQLIEAGKFTLDTQAADILPDLANPVIVDEATKEHRVAKNPITIRHLLEHTSGLGYGEDFKKRGLLPPAYLATHEGIHASKTREEAVKEWFKTLKGDLPGVQLQAEPGTSWEYGTSTDVLGFVVEAISGQSLGDYFKENIFTPLGITSTSFYRTPDLEKRYAKLAVRFLGEKETIPYDNQFPLMEFDPEKVKLHFGGVGLFASPKDYLTLERHLLQILDGTAQNPILKRETLQNFFTPSLSPSNAKSMDAFFYFLPPGQQHALGLGVEQADKGPDRRKKGTGHWAGWAGTIHFMDPETGIAVYAGSQLAPPPQFTLAMVWEEIEPILYKGLERN